MAAEHSLSQSWPSYQLAVVVDDAFQNVNQVVRGDDLISSTPKQILLYQSLNLTPPAFIHLPLVVGEDGKRLAKRHGDTRLSALRNQGVKPESLLGLIAYSCGWVDKPTPVTLRDLMPLFDLNKIPTKPFVLTKDLLKGIGYES
jgi:glutamyl-tRNA synthetase